MRTPLLLLAALALTACSDSEGGGSGGNDSSAEAGSGGDDNGSTSAESGSGGDASSSSASGSGGAGGGGVHDRVALETWTMFQGRFATETEDDEPASKVVVGCSVDLPEIGPLVLYVEHGEPGAEPEGQFVLVAETTEEGGIVVSGVARVHRVAEPEEWAGRCDGEPITAPGAVDLEPASELDVRTGGDGGTGLLLSGLAPAGTFSADASEVAIEAWGVGIDWSIDLNGGGETHDLERLTPLPEAPGSD